MIYAAGIGLFQSEFKHPQHGVQRRADLVTHSGQKARFGFIGGLGLQHRLLMGQAQPLALSDIDPTGDQTDGLAIGCLVRQQPVMNGQRLPRDQQQLAIAHSGLAALHGLQVSRLKSRGLLGVYDRGLSDRQPDHLLAAQTQRLEVAGIAVEQQSLAITHIDGMWRAVDHHPHELQLVGKGLFGTRTTVDLPTLPADPQRRQQ